MQTFRRGYRLALLLAALAMLCAAGCAPKKRAVYADYVLPPNAVTDISSIENLDIAPPQIDLSCNYKSKRSVQNVLANAVEESFEDQLYANGFIKARDDIYDDAQGLAQVRKELRASRHGYDVKSARAMRTAKLITAAKVNLKRTKGVDVVQTQLVTQPYTIKTNKNGVPVSFPDPDRRRVKIVTSNVPFILVEAKGSLRVALQDAHGKNVYSKVFDDLSYERKAGGNAQPGAEPTLFEIAHELFGGAVDQVVKDISPHKESHVLHVNEKGDATAVALMKATAFSEAYNRLDSVITAHEKQYEAEAAEINKDYDAQMAAAETDEALAKLEEEKKAELLDASRFLSPDYENMAIVTEIMGDVSTALDLYGQAVEADPANTSAKQSLERARLFIEASQQVNIDKKARQYDEKLYKER
jgi:tetratricopeptide (TPR) repeat protein